MITDKKEIEKSALSLDKKDKARLADLLLNVSITKEKRNAEIR